MKCPSVVFDRRGHNSENHRVLGLEGAGPGIWEETEAKWEGTCLPQVAFQPLAGMLFITLRDIPKERVESLELAAPFPGQVHAHPYLWNI